MQEPSTSAGHSPKFERKHSPPPGTMQCRECGRYFNIDRIAKHQHVCRRAMKERVVFDAAKHRVKGTEAEKYYKPLTMRTSKMSKSSALSLLASTSGAKGSNWRKKHEEFIAAIRAAREVQAHLAKGGKFLELSPPTPTEHLDYIQCPYCTRRFNETAANRHIPKCAKMIHNKGKLFRRK